MQISVLEESGHECTVRCDSHVAAAAFRCHLRRIINTVPNVRIEVALKQWFLTGGARPLRGASIHFQGGASPYMLYNIEHF